MSFKRILFLFACLFCLSLLLSACGSDNEEATPTLEAIAVPADSAGEERSTTNVPIVIVPGSQDSANAAYPDPDAPTDETSTAPETEVGDAPIGESPRPVDGVVDPAAPVERETHTIEAGETLSQIAEQYGVATADLAVFNELDSVDDIVAGQILTIPTAADLAGSVEPTDVGAPAEQPAESAEADTSAAENPATETESAADGTTGIDTYSVQAGDTLSTIAEQFGVSTADLAAANNIGVNDFIYLGQQLTLPGDSSQTTYTIQAGDSLQGIANNFGVSIDALASANGITDYDDITAGQTLIIPSE
jgi:LysM repeat protein